MKTHRSTQMFLYCSGGERSVKCVCTSLEIEASKEGERCVLRFLVAESIGMRQNVKTPGIFLLHDNACPHIANLVRDKLQRFGWETLQHPPCYPDLSPCHFHIFGDPKKDIRERWFHSNEYMQEWARLWIHQRLSSFYKTGIDRLVSHWDKCINTSDNYF